MVEFALIAPLLFTVIFGAIDGAFFMYAKNTVDRASEVGMNSIAAAGKGTTADLDAITAMRGAGLGNGALVDVTEIDVEQMQYSGGAYTPLNSSGCATGYTTCMNPYHLDGTPAWTIASGCSDAVYHCPPWPPTNRSVKASTASYVRLTIKYTYKFFAGPSQFSLTSTHVFRLEPKEI